MNSCFGNNLEYSSSLESYSDPEADKEAAEQTTLILPLMFQLKPSKVGAISQNDNNYLGMNTTGVTDAIQNIAAEIAKAKYIRINNDVTVISSLTEATLSSPQNSLESSSTLSHNSCELQISGLASLSANKQVQVYSGCGRGHTGGHSCGGGGRRNDSRAVIPAYGQTSTAIRPGYLDTNYN